MHPMDFPAAQEQTDNVELLESNGQLRTYKGQRAAGDSVTESSRREEAVRGDDRFKEHTKRARIRIIEITNRAVNLRATPASPSSPQLQLADSMTTERASVAERTRCRGLRRRLGGSLRSQVQNGDL